MQRPKCLPLCSNLCCIGVAVELSPRHLCADCKADPMLNGREPVFKTEKKEK